MTEDDYKELMRFHLLLADADISKMRYAAVDRDGGLHAYAYKPVDLSLREKDYQWTPREEADNDGATQSSYMFISKLPNLIDWTKTLIKI